MSPAELEYADRRMKQKWYELVQAEQQGASQQVLERMFNAYMLAVEEYNRCSASLHTDQQRLSSRQASSQKRHNPRAS